MCEGSNAAHFVALRHCIFGYTIRFHVSAEVAHRIRWAVYFLTAKSMLKTRALVFALCSLVRCAASTPTASSPESSGPAVKDPAAGSSLAHASENVAVEKAPPPRSDAREQKPSALEIPTECATSSAKICTPPTAFVAKLCQWRSPDVALSMFRKGTPWTRAYMSRRTEAWYMGARHSAPVQMTVDEEVIVLAARGGGTGGVQVSGSGSYDIYRWDGQCASVATDEVRLRRPPAPTAAPIVWQSLSEPTRAALLDDHAIKLRLDQQQDRCGNDSSSHRCTDMTAALTRVIADYVRKGGKLPPTRLTPR